MSSSPDIHLRRAHPWDLAQARQTANTWAQQAQDKFQMQSTVLSTDAADTHSFERPGVKGRLVVTADHFELEVQLGFLFKGFRQKISAEIEKNFERLVTQSGGGDGGAV